MPGDRIVVIASPESAREWSRVIADGRARRRHRDLRRRPDGRDDRPRAARARHPRAARRARAERAREVAEELPETRVFHASAFDREFFEHERIGRATAAVFA